MAKRYFSMRDTGNLSSFLIVAAEKFEANAQLFDAMVNQVPEPGALVQITGKAAESIAQDFRQQAAQARDYAEAFADAHDFEMETYGDDEEED